MRRIVSLAALAVPIFFLGCQGGENAPQALTDADRSQVEAGVLATADQWIGAWEAGDAEATGELLVPSSGDFIYGEAYWVGPEQYLAGAGGLFADWDSMEGDWTRTRVDVLAADAGVFVGDRSSLAQRTDGSQWDVRSLVTFVVTRGESGWKILHGHVSSSWTPHRS